MNEKRSILIVDDDPDIRNVLNLLLRRDYITAEAADGAAAVEYMRQNPETDLVILDVMMPGRGGIETCEKIREHSNVPILFLTAKSAEEDRITAYRSGGDDFLSKPFSQPEQLTAAALPGVSRKACFLCLDLRQPGSGPEHPHGAQCR